MINYELVYIILKDTVIVSLAKQIYLPPRLTVLIMNHVGYTIIFQNRHTLGLYNYRQINRVCLLQTPAKFYYISQIEKVFTSFAANNIFIGWL